LVFGFARHEVLEQLVLVVFVDDDRANLLVACISAEAGLCGKCGKNAVALEDDWALAIANDS
jgi:hypothetical protein